METLIGILIIWTPFLLIYFLPSLVAGSRWSINTKLVFILNLLLWWTFIIWIVCIFLATGKTHKDLKREDCSLVEAQNVVCNLSLIAIAETGFDLCGKPYFLKYPELNAIYRICSRTKKGQKVIESLNGKHRKGA